MVYFLEKVYKLFKKIYGLQTKQNVLLEPNKTFWEKICWASQLFEEVKKIWINFKDWFPSAARTTRTGLAILLASAKSGNNPNPWFKTLNIFNFLSEFNL